MARKSTDKRPDFKNEAEEADWYASPAGRRESVREFERAIKNGTITRSNGSHMTRTDPKVLAELMAQAKERALQSISLRLPVADIERAKQLAAKQKIGYQTLLKSIIHSGLIKRVRQI